MRLRDKALTKYKKQKTSNNWECYRQLRNQVSIAIENVKKVYLENNFQLGDSKNNWKLLKELDIHTKSARITIPPQLGNAEEINMFFINSSNSSAPDPDMLAFYQHNIKQGSGDFHFHLATTDEVCSALFSIKSEAIGMDGIGLSMILNCCPYIIPFIVHLVNYCIETASFPSIWKSSFLLPIPKVALPTQLSELRPISILPTMSKIVERILEGQIKNYVDKYNLLPSFQSGFRRDYSCATALLKVTDDILQAADRGELTTLVLLDYSKAFDRLNHQLLLAILQHLGFKNDACKLIKSYLTGRSQAVKIQGQQSTSKCVTSGVPQGSILGPLLFTLYTSQLTCNLKYASIHLYADDTQLYLSFPPSEILVANEKLSSDLALLCNISKAHSLELNPKKCQLLLFGRSQCRDRHENFVKISLENEVLKCTHVAKNLGLFMDVRLRFTEHIDNCIKKAFINLKLIYRSKHLLNSNMKKMLCDSLVLSHFTFCDVLYSSCLLSRDQKRIQYIQNYCVRMISGLRKYDTGISAKLKEIKWLDMSERRRLHSLVLYNKIIFKKQPEYLYQKIKFRFEAHNLDLRHKFLLTPPTHKTTLFERSFSYNIAALYNDVPINLKSAPPEKFRLEAKRLIISHVS